MSGLEWKDGQSSGLALARVRSWHVETIARVRSLVWQVRPTILDIDEALAQITLQIEQHLGSCLGRNIHRSELYQAFV